jgi:hypothetical protein
MTIPSFDLFIDPLLRLLAERLDGVAARDAIDAVANATGIPADERTLLTPSETDTVCGNRIRWAQDRLKRAGLSFSVRRGVWKATDAGLALVAEYPAGLPAAEVERIADGESEESAEPAHEGATSIAEERLAVIYRNVSERGQCLGFLAMAIEKAHTYGTAVWEVTLQRRRVRLNVGMLLSCEFSVGRIGLGLVSSRLPSDLQRVLDDIGEGSEAFKTHPIARFYRLPVAVFVDHHETLKPAFLDFLEIAGRSARQTPYAYAHSPSFIDHLERVVGRPLPRPTYTRRERSSDEAPEERRVERAVAQEAPRALFKKVDYDLTTLLTYIDMGDVGLPDIQRPFVWSPTKVRDLFDSMFRGFPIGYLLLWENSEPNAGRAIGTGEKPRKTPSRLIVDGQQRLTSLYAVLRGRKIIDEDYRETSIEIAFRPRDCRFEVSDAAIRKDPEYIPNISYLWASGKPVRRLVNEFLKTLGERRVVSPEDEDALSHNIDRLFDLQKYPFTALEILPDIEEESVADIFVRINSEGVKLNQADFILTLLSVFWDDGRANLERFARLAKIPPTPESPPSPFNHLLQPSPDQMLRVAVAVGFHRGRLKSVYQVLRGRDLATGQFIAERREQQFERLREAQGRALDLTHWHLFLGSVVAAGFRSHDMISSETAVLYAYAFYLIGKLQCGVREPLLQRLVSRWIFMSMLTGRYTNSTETVMDADLARVTDLRDADDFVATLYKIITDTLTNDFWSITVANDLETSSARSPALFAYLAAQNRLGAPVLFSDKKIGDLFDPALRMQRKAIEKHHLFPRGWLERNGITDLKLINQAANFAYVEWPDNADVSAQPPEKYLPAMRARFSNTAWDRMTRAHGLPPGWESMTYREFLQQRRKLMAGVIRRGFESMSGDDDADATPPDSSAEERKTWTLIERLELALRRIVRSRYDARWGDRADKQLRASLGEEGWAAIERNREKQAQQYPLSPSAGPRDVLDYCYLGQLGQFMAAGPAWDLFREMFRDKRQLEDLVKAVTPVRNDRAHFRTVPDRELKRCGLACEDLLTILTRSKELP